MSSSSWSFQQHALRREEAGQNRRRCCCCPRGKMWDRFNWGRTGGASVAFAQLLVSLVIASRSVFFFFLSFFMCFARWNASQRTSSSIRILATNLAGCCFVLLCAEIMDRSGKDGRPPPQRRMSFNYKWDVQEQSASISFSSFGLTLTKRPLDLLDESFERSDQSAPVSLIHLSQGQVFASRDVSTIPADERKGHFSLSEWFCPRLSRGPSRRANCEAASALPLDLATSYVDSSTVRLTDNRRFDPLLLEECADHDYWQRQRRFPLRRPLPSLPAPPLSTEDGDNADRELDEEEEYFHSHHLSLVVITRLVRYDYPFQLSWARVYYRWPNIF